MPNRKDSRGSERTFEESCNRSTAEGAEINLGSGKGHPAVVVARECHEAEILGDGKTQAAGAASEQVRAVSVHAERRGNARRAGEDLAEPRMARIVTRDRVEHRAVLRVQTKLPHCFQETSLSFL